MALLLGEYLSRANEVHRDIALKAAIIAAPPASSSAVAVRVAFVFISSRIFKLITFFIFVHSICSVYLLLFRLI